MHGTALKALAVLFTFFSLSFLTPLLFATTTEHDSTTQQNKNEDELRVTSRAGCLACHQNDATATYENAEKR